MAVVDFLVLALDDPPLAEMRVIFGASLDLLVFLVATDLYLPIKKVCIFCKLSTPTIVHQSLSVKYFYRSSEPSRLGIAFFDREREMKRRAVIEP